MLKKLFPLFLISLLLVMVGCEVSGTVSSDTDSITMYTLSSVKDSVGRGDKVEIYFGFSASDYISQSNANLVIKDGTGKIVTSLFSYEISNFSEKVVSTAEKKCSFSIVVPNECEDGLYTVTLDLIIGSKKATAYYVLQVGQAPGITITVLNKSIEAGKTGLILATVDNGVHLTKEAFTVSMDAAGSANVPTVTVQAFENNQTLVLNLSASNVVSGLYTGCVKILSEDISQPFTITVTDLASAEIELINNASLTQGETTTTTAKIINGDGLTPSDFEVVVAGAISDNFTLKSPTAEVTHYNSSNGIATIKIDATKADAGTFSATLKVEGNEKDFTIVVKEGATVDEISIDWVDLANWLAEAGDNNIFQYTLSASEVVTEEVISVSFENSSDGSSATDYFVVTISEFEAQYTYKTMDPKSYVVVSVNSNCPAGTYVMTIMADLGAASSAQKVTILVQDVDPVEITSIENVSLDAGSTGATTALIKNGSSLTKDDFSVSVAGSGSINGNDGVPTASIASYVNGVVVITINGTWAKAGTYTGTLKIDTDEKDFTITVEQSEVSLTEKSMKLYNPYGAKESAYNLVTGTSVMASGPDASGKMSYSDSSIVDIALDNDADIRDTKIVTELTSVNGGYFHEATSSDYENATDLSLRTLCDGTTFTDNEAVMFSVGSVYTMKLANGRGYVIFKITSIDYDDIEGSSGNTGKMGFVYKYVSVN